MTKRGRKQKRLARITADAAAVAAAAEVRAAGMDMGGDEEVALPGVVAGGVGLFEASLRGDSRPRFPNGFMEGRNTRSRQGGQDWHDATPEADARRNWAVDDGQESTASAPPVPNARGFRGDSFAQAPAGFVPFDFHAMGTASLPPSLQPSPQSHSDAAFARGTDDWGEGLEASRLFNRVSSVRYLSRGKSKFEGDGPVEKAGATPHDYHYKIRAPGVASPNIAPQQQQRRRQQEDVQEQWWPKSQPTPRPWSDPQPRPLPQTHSRYELHSQMRRGPRPQAQFDPRLQTRKELQSQMRYGSSTQTRYDPEVQGRYEPQPHERSGPEPQMHCQPQLGSSSSQQQSNRDWHPAIGGGSVGDRTDSGGWIHGGGGISASNGNRRRKRSGNNNLAQRQGMLDRNAVADRDPTKVPASQQEGSGWWFEQGDAAQQQDEWSYAGTAGDSGYNAAVAENATASGAAIGVAEDGVEKAGVSQTLPAAAWDGSRHRREEATRLDRGYSEEGIAEGDWRWSERASGVNNGVVVEGNHSAVWLGVDYGADAKGGGDAMGRADLPISSFPSETNFDRKKHSGARGHEHDQHFVDSVASRRALGLHSERDLRQQRQSKPWKQGEDWPRSYHAAAAAADVHSAGHPIAVGASIDARSASATDVGDSGSYPAPTGASFERPSLAIFQRASEDLPHVASTVQDTDKKSGKAPPLAAGSTMANSSAQGHTGQGHVAAAKSLPPKSAEDREREEQLWARLQNPRQTKPPSTQPLPLPSPQPPSLPSPQPPPLPLPPPPPLAPPPPQVFPPLPPSPAPPLSLQQTNQPLPQAKSTEVEETIDSAEVSPSVPVHDAAPAASPVADRGSFGTKGDAAAKSTEVEETMDGAEVSPSVFVHDAASAVPPIEDRGSFGTKGDAAAKSTEIEETMDGAEVSPSVPVHDAASAVPPVADRGSFGTKGDAAAKSTEVEETIDSAEVSQSVPVHDAAPAVPPVADRGSFGTKGDAAAKSTEVEETMDITEVSQSVLVHDAASAVPPVADRGSFGTKGDAAAKSTEVEETMNIAEVSPGVPVHDAASAVPPVADRGSFGTKGDAAAKSTEVEETMDITEVSQSVPVHDAAPAAPPIEDRGSFGTKGDAAAKSTEVEETMDIAEVSPGVPVHDPASAVPPVADRGSFGTKGDAPELTTKAAGIAAAGDVTRRVNGRLSREQDAQRKRTALRKWRSASHDLALVLVGASNLPRKVCAKVGKVPGAVWVDRHELSDPCSLPLEVKAVLAKVLSERMAPCGSCDHNENGRDHLLLMTFTSSDAKMTAVRNLSELGVDTTDFNNSLRVQVEQARVIPPPQSRPRSPSSLPPKLPAESPPVTTPVSSKTTEVARKDPGPVPVAAPKPESANSDAAKVTTDTGFSIKTAASKRAKEAREKALKGLQAERRIAAAATAAKAAAVAQAGEKTARISAAAQTGKKATEKAAAGQAGKKATKKAAAAQARKKPAEAHAGEKATEKAAAAQAEKKVAAAQSGKKAAEKARSNEGEVSLKADSEESRNTGRSEFGQGARVVGKKQPVVQTSDAAPQGRVRVESLPECAVDKCPESSAKASGQSRVSKTVLNSDKVARDESAVEAARAQATTQASAPDFAAETISTTPVGPQPVRSNALGIGKATAAAVTTFATSGATAAAIARQKDSRVAETSVMHPTSPRVPQARRTPSPPVPATVARRIGGDRAAATNAATGPRALSPTRRGVKRVGIPTGNAERILPPLKSLGKRLVVTLPSGPPDPTLQSWRYGFSSEYFRLLDKDSKTGESLPWCDPSKNSSYAGVLPSSEVVLDGLREQVKQRRAAEAAEAASAIATGAPAPGNPASESSGPPKSSGKNSDSDTGSAGARATRAAPEARGKTPPPSLDGNGAQVTVSQEEGGAKKGKVSGREVSKGVGAVAGSSSSSQGSAVGRVGVEQDDESKRRSRIREAEEELRSLQEVKIPRVMKALTDVSQQRRKLEALTTSVAAKSAAANARLARDSRDAAAALMEELRARREVSQRKQREPQKRKRQQQESASHTGKVSGGISAGAGDVSPRPSKTRTLAKVSPDDSDPCVPVAVRAEEKAGMQGFPERVSEVANGLGSS